MLNCYENLLVCLIEVDIEQLIKKNSIKTVNKTLTLPALRNEAGIKKKLNVSNILQDGIKKELGI